LALVVSAYDSGDTPTSTAPGAKTESFGDDLQNQNDDRGNTTNSTAPGAKTEAFSDDLQFAVTKILSHSLLLAT